MQCAAQWGQNGRRRFLQSGLSIFNQHQLFVDDDIELTRKLHDRGLESTRTGYL